MEFFNWNWSSLTGRWRHGFFYIFAGRGFFLYEKSSVSATFCRLRPSLFVCQITPKSAHKNDSIFDRRYVNLMMDSAFCFHMDSVVMTRWIKVHLEDNEGLLLTFILLSFCCIRLPCFHWDWEVKFPFFQIAGFGGSIWIVIVACCGKEIGICFNCCCGNLKEQPAGSAANDGAKPPSSVAAGATQKNDQKTNDGWGF